MNEYEEKVLRMVAGDIEWAPWGAWVGACIEFLQHDGLITRGGILSMPVLTDKGRKVLEALDMTE